MVAYVVPDDEYLYSSEERERLDHNLAAIYTAFDSGQYLDNEYCPELLCKWHYRLFAGVRDGHAGKHRSADFGPEKQDFGPNKSAHRKEVPQLFSEHSEMCRRHCHRLQSEVAELDIRFADESVRSACYIHADLIQIHPFVDGNGRVGRLVLDWFLLRAGFPVVAFHFPKKEYIDALNYYYRTNDIEPLVVLVLREYSRYLR